MKIKKLMTLCSKSGNIIVYKAEDGTQWLSEGHALYPVYKDFEFDSHSLCEMYDIDKDKVAMHDVTGLPFGMSGVDYEPSEIECEMLPIQLYRGGDVYIALENTNGIAFIKKKFLSPLSDVASSISCFSKEKRAAVLFMR